MTGRPNADDWRRARVVADKLLSSNSPNDHWEEVDALSRNECLALDAIAFECQTCNLWFSVQARSERDGQFYCADCI